ncbi:heat shock 70 kDa protein 12A-like [Saccostrea cucullata]|uniref:heat shock 70 kDa protein 12A-like n=1 Tax=Saccostrea cuccullata TaxID=36930 RepID=UPI002ED3E307
MDQSIKSKSKKLFVAAIDFGTTYSGYAFSISQNWRKLMACHWQGGGLISHKAPTALLLKKAGGSDPVFEAFGYTAEDRYATLTAKKEHKDYLYFQRFKMILHKDFEVNKSIECSDITGEKLEATQVFMHCIRYLKDHLIDKINEKFAGTSDRDIEYVLTVPAIWGDKAKMFMREAAVKAGIEKDHLIMALEPEAASIYCQHLQIENLRDPNASVLGSVDNGTTYMVVDLGGGTADITVHKKCIDNTLEEIMPASGGPWGGKSVDDKFIDFLSELGGKKVLKLLKETNMEDYVDILRTFERTKRAITLEKKGNVFVRIPLSFINLCKKENNLDDFSQVIKKSPHKENVNYGPGKLKMTADFVRGFFKKTSDGIVKHIEDLFNEEAVRDVNHILMVGGFSECKLIQKAIKDNFPEKRVIIPEESGLAILYGAVYFGHIPDAISRRVARFTYGIQTWPKFDSKTHRKEKQVDIKGEKRCKDVFFSFVRKGEQISNSFSKSQIFRPLHTEDAILECGIFVSTEKNPEYVDDASCRRLGTLRVSLPKVSDATQLEIEETFYFGETELRVVARDVISNLSQDIVVELL